MNSLNFHCTRKNNFWNIFPSRNYNVSSMRRKSFAIVFLVLSVAPHFRCRVYGGWWKNLGLDLVLVTWKRMCGNEVRRLENEMSWRPSKVWQRSFGSVFWVCVEYIVCKKVIGAYILYNKYAFFFIFSISCENPIKKDTFHGEQCGWRCLITLYDFLFNSYSQIDSLKLFSLLRGKYRFQQIVLVHC